MIEGTINTEMEIKKDDKIATSGIYGDNRDVVKLLKTDFLENNEKFDVVGFFRKSPGHYFLLIMILEHSVDHSPITFETILKKIPSKFGSRSKIFKIFKEAVDIGYLIKKKNYKDGREQIYYPSVSFIKQTNEWLSIFQKI